VAFLNPHTNILASVKKLSDANPPSRPTPLYFMPPKGTRRSRRSQQLIQIVSASSEAAILCVRERKSRVDTQSKRPI